MEPRNVFWKKELIIKGTSWTISGYSRAAFRTGFFIKGLNCMLDAGPQLHKNPESVFITHTHGDHIANLPFTMIRDIETTDNIKLYAPIESQKYLDQYIAALFNVNSLSDQSMSVSQSYDFIGILPTYAVRRLKLNGTDIQLDTCAADHTIPTVVYGFSQVKKKLDDQYKGLSGKEIVEIKKTGIDVMKETIEPKFSYVLDTSIEVFKMHPFLLNYPVIIVECTFILDDELNNAVVTKHIHWQQLKPYVLANPKTIFILVHFSLRYKDEEIKEFFDKDKLKNVELWLSDLAV